MRGMRLVKRSDELFISRALTEREIRSLSGLVWWRMPPMKKYTRVGWTLKDGSKGTGQTISDEDDGHVLVAVDPLVQATDGSYRQLTQASQEFHPVIHCAVTWLTAVPEPVAPVIVPDAPPAVADAPPDAPPAAPDAPPADPDATTAIVPPPADPAAP